MTDYIMRVIIYLLCFIVSFYALGALDFNRFLKKNKVVQAQLLYILLSLSLAYLTGTLLLSVLYHFAL
ncbi:MAG: DUF1146 domain-containing protein [Erysipelotrichaceae bacterium]|nr:DUF1146 domain-containing protein [Erysipelotrichaceae bacterium]